MADIGPVILTVAGDKFIQGVRIAAIIWEGATTAGDTVLVSDPATGAVIWPGRTDSGHTYLGANFGPKGIHLPNGFQLSQISAGRVCVYLAQA